MMAFLFLETMLSSPQSVVKTGFTPGSALKRRRLRRPSVAATSVATAHDVGPMAADCRRYGLSPAFAAMP
jgi:hypothetical protein